MARLRVPEAVSERWQEEIERFWTAYGRFRESRLYVQVVCAMGLLVVASLVHLLPYGPLARADQAVAWAVTQDYDFAGQAAKLNGWATVRGGWMKASASLWADGMARVREWVGPVGAPKTANAPPSTAPLATDPSANAPPATSAAPPPADQAAPAEAPSPAPTSTAQEPAAESGALGPLLPVEGSVMWEYGWLPQGVAERFHEGIDFLAKAGAPVVAIQDGTVTAVRQDKELGGVVEIRHGEIIGLYAQVETVAVRAGDEVRRGQRIANVARSSGVEQNLPPHLHFEIRPVETGEPVNPAAYLGLGGSKL